MTSPNQTGQTPRPWINDRCTESFIFPITRRRLEGILAIHAPCEPPCPRKISARAHLETLLAAGESGGSRP